MPTDVLLTPADAAAYLRLAVQTLAHWRVQGQGPPYLKCGRLIRYRQADLEAWTQAQTRAHTSAPSVGRVTVLRRKEQDHG